MHLGYCQWSPVLVGRHVVGHVSDSVRFIVSTLRSICVCLTSRGRLGPREHLGAACEGEKGHLARTPTKPRCTVTKTLTIPTRTTGKASNTGGTDDEGEREDGKDADDCDAAAESRRFRSTKVVNTTPQMTCFRDARVCKKWLQVRIDDHRIQSDYKYKSELQNQEGKTSVLGITSAW